MAQPSISPVRQQLVVTAYNLIARRGYPTLGVDRITAEAGVSKMSLYRHFGSKDELVVAVLALRAQLWTRDWLEQAVEQAEDRRGGRLLAIFDAFDEWFHHTDFEGCTFTNSLLESHDGRTRIGAAAIAGLEDVHAFVASLAAAAGAADPDGLAREWQLLMEGSIISACQGHLDSAHRARAIGTLLLERERLTA